MLKSLDPDQARHFARPDLGRNCLQRLPADEKVNDSLSAKFQKLNVPVDNLD